MKADTVVTNAWYVLGFPHEFTPGRLQSQTITGKPVVMWRTASGKVVAFDGRCLHKRMPLKEGRFVAEDVLECAYHGFCYDAEGRCIKVPSQPDAPIPANWKLRGYPIVEQDDLVWIWPGDPEKIGHRRPPRTPEIASADWESIRSEPMLVKANYRLLIENLLDITHFYPLHDGNVGDIEHSKIPVEVLEEEIEGNRAVRTVRNAKNYRQPPYFVDWFGYDVVDRFHTHCMVNPGLTRVEMRAAPPGTLESDAERGYVLYHMHTPIDEKTHFWRWCINCRMGHRGAKDPSKSLAQLFVDMFPAVVEQDRWVLERQQEMVSYPDDGYAEVHVKADRALLLVRKIVAELEAESA